MHRDSPLKLSRNVGQLLGAVREEDLQCLAGVVGTSQVPNSLGDCNAALRSGRQLVKLLRQWTREPSAEDCTLAPLCLWC